MRKAGASLVIAVVELTHAWETIGSILYLSQHRFAAISAALFDAPKRN